jgi:DNA polymerase-3 subunit chi
VPVIGFRPLPRGWARLARDGQRVLVYAPVEADLERLDRLLWAQPSTGFTPHCNDGSVLAAETPIVLASRLDKPIHDGCLVNLSDEIPSGFGSFDHLVEIVGSADSDRIAGRERYRFYRERGYPLDARDISGDAA